MFYKGCGSVIYLVMPLKDLCLLSFNINTQQMKQYQKASGSMVEWLTCQTSNLRIASCMGSNPVTGTSCCFLEQETLHSLLSTDWFKEWI